MMFTPPALRYPLKGLSILLALALSLTLALATGGSATASSAPPALSAGKTVASTPQGTMRTRIVGETANGRDVTGSFIPVRFVKRDGKVKVRGMINGVVHNADGTTRTFSAIRTLRVSSINGTPVSSRTSARATCDILRLTLGPLDLDLLGLQVHLDRVVLNIVAATGAGNLLGNLLCAVTGLLDGGLFGLLDRLTLLLNRILSQLGLGL